MSEPVGMTVGGTLWNPPLLTAVTSTPTLAWAVVLVSATVTSGVQSGYRLVKVQVSGAPSPSGRFPLGCRARARMPSAAPPVSTPTAQRTFAVLDCP
jgi:hypothetical protein